MFSSPHPPITVPSGSFHEHLSSYDASYPADTRVAIDGLSGHIVTRATFKHRCLILASSLRAMEKVGLLALHRGSTVTVLSPNTTLYPALLVALGAAGVVGAFASSAYVDQELAHAFTVSGSSHILVHVALLPTAIAALRILGYSKDEMRKRVLLLHEKKDIPAEMASQGWITLDALPSESLPNIPEHFDETQSKDETALIFFSSGTTGRSKAVALSHYNVNAILTQVGSIWPYYTPGRDVVLGVIPFFHVFGGMMALLFSYMKGVPVVVLPRFEPEQFLGCIAKYKVTTALLVPPLLTFLAKDPLVDRYEVSSLRLIAVGAAPIAASTLQRCIDRFGKKGVQLQISQAYGLSESSAALALLPVDRMKDCMGSVGPLLPSVEARLVDENGADVPGNGPGELWARGPNIMQGYVGNAEATAATITPDGWLKTGDVAVRDQNGFITIVDRLKELIKYKGFQVPPAELEAVLPLHPGVADAGVVGVYSDEEGTELPLAYIVPKDADLLKGGDQEAFKRSVQDFLKDRVASYKLLRGGVVLINAIPRSAAGKILRRDLRGLAERTKAKL